MTGVVYDVAIVGYGPSGAVAAGLLGQAGMQVYVCDKMSAVYDKPRAIALDHEIQRVFQQLGVMDEIEPYCEPFTDSCYYGVDGQLIRRMTMVDKPYPQGFTPSVVFTQPPVEAVLRRKVASLPSVTVDLGVTVIGLQQDKQQDQTLVHLTVEHQDGHSRTISARYVIGCDGASSTVRSLSGIMLEDLDFDEPWLVVDVLANEQGLRKLPQTSVQYCEPERPCTFVIGPGNHRRWEISLKESEDPQLAATPEGTWQLLQRWITPDDAQLWRQASYRFHALVADRWREGCVFIAGDAAHQQPPFLGQGMCQGVRDVSNLVWKLLSVLNKAIDGEAAGRLLDSYGVERKEHVRQLTTTLKAIGAVICERDTEKARSRDQKLLNDCQGEVRPTPRQDVLPRLTTGLISDSAAAGSLFPQPWVASAAGAVRMDQQLGHGWRLISLADSAGAVNEQLRALLSLTVARLGSDQLTEQDNVLAGWFDRHQVTAALVRPDNYVYGTAATHEALQVMQQQLLQALSGKES
ncbi:FAD-binding monooxygenase [Pokkaliibacter plantistimulans]|uniref:FAD-binding monooxygenase n=1 Tax=Pokkaliibacter plantistimulans TaxID=1635171 RepID=A0ABX5LR80_9GAMM|nr:bifunctional 3-(3-hydroxy-phenyl)propionate/3-hydroxycinnamic acid hydroxylase [Pokkaliibacter plantistimulans]PXF29112.1 FAD-binding monooxygenase [Pokkaliibacter plantistimulans]